MKYKVLITGRAFPVIDDFFVRTQDTFECMSTSDRELDLQLHVKLFQPDIFVFCPKEETKERMERISEARYKAEKEVMMVVIGDSADVQNFTSACKGAVDLVLHKPISISKVQEEILSIIRAKERKAAEKVAMEAQAAEEARLAMEAQEQGGADNSGMKHVLVIDDDPVMLKTIKRYLGEEYNVATALAGKIALKFLEKRTTDVILLDYEMPSMNGPEVLDILRANEKTKNIPVVFLTGVNEVDKIQKVLTMKPQGYMLKPVNNEELHRTLKKILG
ncbi:MAG: response regulator [Lachnospiraceae bacterium]|nr:response regulator [Lachnospiraceae bacterium]MDE6744737.1 response regulator [Lachnospiraceae bacterium]